MLSPEALSGKSLDSVLEGIRADARIIGYGPNATLLVYVEPGQIGRLRQNSDVSFFQAMPPADKISLDTGIRPLIEKARATDTNLLLEVAVVPGSNAAAVRDAIGRVPGVVNVADYGPEGSALLVRADYRSLSKLARIHEILNIQESLELMTLNAKESPAIQVGTAEISNMARPFDDLGVDGGGIDTNGDGQRDNLVKNSECVAAGSPAGCCTGAGTGTCTPDTVPPQLVAVLDNGISADTPSFSQTATQVFDLTHPFPSPQHRKVHSIIAVLDNGDDCDATLDGAGSHGNTVASVIAAWARGVGAFATRSGIGGTGQPRNTNLDGVARGARIIVSDIADLSRCTINSLVERGGNVDPGSLAARLNQIICPKGAGPGICTGIVGGGSEVHLAVTPFGTPDNFSTLQFQLNDGTYPQQSADIDTFLYNNRDFMTFAPAGNSGVAISSSRPSFWTPRFIPDLFDGSSCDEDPNRAVKLAIQIPPPATAKNSITVGLTRADEGTLFADFDNLANMATFSSRGPATPESLRMAPILDAPGSDLGPGAWETSSIAVFRSRDDDNLGPVDAQLDEANYGTSYAAAGATGAAALVRDYFAQGLYPTGDRVTGNRVPNVSGALVKATLVASARFTTTIRTPGETTKSTTDKVLRRTRSTDVGTLCGNVPIGVMGNSEQGYGRVVLTNVLPLPNWSKSFRLGGVNRAGARWTAGNTPPGTMHWEFPAQGLLAWDDIATGEQPLGNNTLAAACTNGATSCTHTFRVASATTVGAAGTGLAADKAQLRVQSEVHDRRNPQEAIHLSFAPNNDPNPADSQIFLGTWRATVKRGQGGAIAGQITITGPNEDANVNRRLDPGEDTNLNGLLDLGGQTYALVVAGPVYLAEAAPSKGPTGFPQSSITLDKVGYSCEDTVVATIYDSTPGAGASRCAASTTFSVRNAAGQTVDTETGIGCTASPSLAGATPSSAVPARRSSSPVPNNGILETDTGMQVVATYAPVGQTPVQTPVSAAGKVDCSPNFVPGFFAIKGNNVIGPQEQVGGGCDNDDNLDAGEVVTYGVALTNRGRDDLLGTRWNDYADVVATLTPSGPGAAAVRVLDSPKNIGHLPAGQVQGAFFHVAVDSAAANALSVANRVVTMTLTLDSLNKGKRIDQQSYAFTHAI